ncbi:karyopherin (importin) beta 3 [Anaeramoeba flamelloides]|uniref:Karyopherin (Importin) beta 3 n=1 Tax=Anaeramoeba flamelloides TaxID=1746091 RepID=A0ABQ8XVU9_9EUKA|nr:karyopherin (importin) beta 3 [Anaeramoeba flamelloides]
MGENDQKEFEELLIVLQSTNNELRNTSETNYFEFRNNQPDLCCELLLSMISFSSNDNVRALSMILLRQMVLSQSPLFWKSFKSQTKELLKKNLLELVQNEQVPYLKRKMADVIAIIGAILIPDQKWDELLNFIIVSPLSKDDLLSELGLYLIQGLTIYIGDILSANVETFFPIFEECLKENMAIKIRVSCFKAVATFAIHCEEEEDKEMLKELFPHMLKTLETLIANKKYEIAEHCLRELIQLAEFESNFFSKDINLLVECMISLVVESNLEIGVSNLALEVLVSLIETAPRVVMKDQDFLPKILPSLIDMLIDIDEEDEWEEEEEIEVLQNSQYAENALGRIAISIGSEYLFPHVSKLLPDLLTNSNNWKHQIGGLQLLSTISDGCRLGMLDELKAILQIVLPYLQNKNDRIRHSAIKCLGHLSKDLSPNLQNEYHSDIIPALIEIIANDSNNFNRSETVNTIISFVDPIDSSNENDLQNIIIYCDELLEKLLDFFPQGKIEHQELIIRLISAIALKIDSNFIPYYDVLMPMIKEAIKKTDKENQRLLRGKLFECATIIGNSCGIEKFEKDGHEIMEFTLKLFNQGLKNDDPQIDHIFYSWSRISATLKDKFVDYLQYVIEPLINQASVELEKVLFKDKQGNEIGEREAEKLREECEVMIFGEDETGIKTYSIQDRITALDNLFILSHELTELFFPFIEQIIPIAFDNLSMFYSGDLRIYSTLIISELVKSVYLYGKKTDFKEPNEEWMNNFCKVLFEKIGKSLIQESDPAVLGIKLKSFCTCLKYTKGLVNSDLIIPCLQIIPQLLEDSDERRLKIISRLNNDQDNEQNFDNDKAVKLFQGEIFEMSEQSINEETIKLEIVESCTKIIKYHSELYLVFFRELLFPICDQYLKIENILNIDRQVAFCLIDDIFEYAPIELVKYYWGKTYEYFFKNTLADHSGVRQAVVYGIGVCAEKLEDDFIPQINDSLQILNEALLEKDSRNSKMAVASDNAISALAKILWFHSKNIKDFEKYFNQWLNYLPVFEDIEEAQITYKYLCLFIKEFTISYFCKNFDQLKEILSLLLDIFHSEYVTNETNIQITEIISQIRNQIDEKEFEQIIKSLDSNEIIEKIKNFL